jgi:hypothetical protein
MVIDMRTTEQIDFIKSTTTDPYSVDYFLSEEEVNYLIALFETNQDNNDTLESQKKIYKNTGPVTLDMRKFENDIVYSTVLKRLEEYIGPFEVANAFFFTTTYPHIIHNDDTFELNPNVYRGITLPLRLDSDSQLVDFPYLCFFDQYYFHGPVKFFKNEEFIPTYYNKCLYEYSNTEGLVNSLIDDATIQKYFTHVKPIWLEGLSLHSVKSWTIGSALIFDSTRLHCASDFRKLGIKSKLGISIFTNRKVNK